MEEIEFHLEHAKESMDKSVAHTASELGKIRAGKASPAMLEGLFVDYYGNSTPINQVAAINTPDARSITVKPWEKNMIPEVEKAIINSDLGLNPQNDGEIIRINVPPLTEERRKNLVKQAKAEAENGKISIRNIRKETNDALKKLLKDGLSEDAIKSAEDEVQSITNAHVSKVDQILAKKEEDIMTI